MLGETRSSGSDLDPIKQLLRICQQKSVTDTDLETIRDLVSRDDVDINQLIEIDDEGFIVTTLLVEACENSEMRVVECLVEQGASINKCVSYGITPLHKAVKRRHQEMMEFLIAKEADVNFYFNPSPYPGLLDTHRDTPFHYAVKTGDINIVQIFLDAGAKIDSIGEDGYRPLHIAVESLDIKMVRFLYENGAKLNFCARERGLTALNMAAKNGFIEKVKFLVKSGADLSIPDYSDHNPLHNAIMARKREVVEYLVDEAGADPNMQSRRGGYMPIHMAAESGKGSIVKFLVQRGADVNAITPSLKTTPIYLAAKYCPKEIVKFLIECGADVNVATREGETPLHRAVERNNAEMVEWLVFAGADVNAVDKYYGTALHIAAKKCNTRIVQFLIAAGADVNSRWMWDSLPLKGAEEQDRLNREVKKGATPLHYAAERGDVEVVKVLVRNGADLNAKARNFYGKTPLIVACHENHTDVALFLLNQKEQIVEHLDHHEKSTLRNPLYAPVLYDNKILVERLLDCGANPDAYIDSRLGTLLYAALQSGSYNSAMSLISRNLDELEKRFDLFCTDYDISFPGERAIKVMEKSEKFSRDEKINLFAAIYEIPVKVVEKVFSMADSREIRSSIALVTHQLFTYQFRKKNKDAHFYFLPDTLYLSSELRKFFDNLLDQSSIGNKPQEITSRSVSAGGAKGVEELPEVSKVNPAAEQVGQDFSANVAAARGATGYTGEDDSKAVRVGEDESKNGDNLPMPGFGSDNPSSAGDSTHAAALTSQQRNQELANRGAGCF